MIARSLIKKLVLWLIPVVSLAMFATPALPHGSLQMEDDLCKLRLGRYFIHFAGYQPRGKRDPSRFTEFCEDIPEVGETYVVLDLIDQELRSMPIAVRVLEDRGMNNDEMSQVLFEMPGEPHPSGTFSYEYNFDKPGRFIGLITAGTGDEQMTARFPFSVGQKKTSYWTYIFILGAGLIAAGFLVMFALRRHEKELRKSNTA